MTYARVEQWEWLSVTNARTRLTGLQLAAAFYGVTVVLHTADHLRRGVSAVTPEVLLAGALSTIAAIVAIALAFMAKRSAAVVAAGVGLFNAVGVAAVHLLPRWGALSDSFTSGNAEAVSWAAVLLEIAGALAFGVAGLYELRESRPAATKNAGTI
jgi:hypothetical protein